MFESNTSTRHIYIKHKVVVENTYLKKSNSLYSWDSTVINQLKGINRQRMENWCPPVFSKGIQILFPNSVQSFLHAFNKFNPPGMACPGGEDPLGFVHQIGSNC